MRGLGRLKRMKAIGKLFLPGAVSKLFDLLVFHQTTYPSPSWSRWSGGWESGGQRDLFYVAFHG